MRQAVWCVFSAFRPGPDLVPAVAAALAQSEGVIVVDDGGGGGHDAVWRALERVGAHVIRLPENSGIAAALNRGIGSALDRGADAVVTFDQDSRIEPGFVDGLVEVQGIARGAQGYAVPVVPQYFADVDQSSGRREDGALDTRNVIQSGMLIPAETLALVGPLQEDLFIDLVDTEFSMRCHLAGRAPVAAAGLSLPHSLGMQLPRRIFGVPLPGRVTVSTPFRYYYRVRNRVALTRRYGRLLWRWALRDALVDVAYFLSVLPLARPRRGLWRLYRAGLSDGLGRRMGRIPASVESLARDVTWRAH